MATRKTASKVKKKASLNVNLKSNNTNKRTAKKVNKELKKMSAGAILVAGILLIVGAVGGFWGFKVLTKNDCFVLIGNEAVERQIGESYEDEGVKIVAFGKDDSKNVIIETNLTKNPDGTYTSNEEGTYYIAYTVNNFKYGTLFKIQKIRLITFVDATEEGEMQGGGI